MDFPYELLINAIVAGVLLGGFYIAVTVGISTSGANQTPYMCA